MKDKINIKARINRHLRIARQNVWFWKKIYNKSFFSYRVTFVLFIIVFIIPIYPSLSGLVYKNELNFYRWNIDESSILSSYYLWTENSWNPDLEVFNKKSSYISVNTILDNKRDLKWVKEIIKYEVEPWDSLSSIAYDFGISVESILWANWFSKNHIIHPWEEIKFPPVSWLIYSVKKWDTLGKIAKKYKIEVSEIEKQNDLSNSWILLAWKEIVLPWAEKIIPKAVYKNPTKTTTNKKIPTKKYVVKTKTNSSYSVSKWNYKLTRRKPLPWFAAWNCTRYVAQYKNVAWRWNANRWMANAKKAWYITWHNPRPWAIIQFSGRWYNPRYGHVWIVTEVQDKYIIVSDMNYRRLYEVTYRKIPRNDRSIVWYIYVD